MANHVTFTIPERDLGRADIEFDVSHDVRNRKVKLGTLQISKGSLVWVPKDCSYGYKVNWQQFDTLMQENGTRET
jgi:hypothetical protein